MNDYNKRRVSNLGVTGKLLFQQEF